MQLLRGVLRTAKERNFGSSRSQMASIAKILGDRTTVEPLHTKYELLGFLILAYLRKIMVQNLRRSATILRTFGVQVQLGRPCHFQGKSPSTAPHRRSTPSEHPWGVVRNVLVKKGPLGRPFLKVDPNPNVTFFMLQSPFIFICFPLNFPLPAPKPHTIHSTHPY